VKPAQRYGGRGSQFVRQWKLLLLLRQGQHTLSGLAQQLGCCQRARVRAYPCHVMAHQRRGRHGRGRDNLLGAGHVPGVAAARGGAVRHAEPMSKRLVLRPPTIATGKGKGWSGGLSFVPRTLCAMCGTPFYAPPVRLKRGHGRFCSMRCSGAASASLTPQWPCAKCGKLIKRAPSRRKRTRSLWTDVSAVV
jgi:hypothetical protein